MLRPLVSLLWVMMGHGPTETCVRETIFKLDSDSDLLQKVPHGPGPEETNCPSLPFKNMWGKVKYVSELR